MDTKPARPIALVAAALFVVMAAGVFVKTLIREEYPPVLISISPSQNLAAISGSGSGLLLYYTFDDGTANDSSGSANPGTLSGGPTPIAGRIGTGAMSFDGIDDKINTVSNFIGTSPLTFAAWVRPRVLGAGNTFLYNGATILSGIDGNRFRFTSNNSVYVSSASNALPLNVWKFIAVTRDASGITNLYVDGARSGTTNVAGGAPAFGTRNVTIAGNDASGVFNGDMDDVRIYNRALSQSEIGEIYALGGGSAPAPTDPVATSTPPDPEPEAPPRARSGDLFSNLFSTKRIIDWSGVVGVPGGIPNRTTKCVTTACVALEAASADYKSGALNATPLIQTALTSAPDNTFVQIPAGTFRLDSGVSFNNRANVTLRGAGPGRTILDPMSRTSGEMITSGGVNWLGPTSVLSGSTKGSRTITVASAAGIGVGKLVHIYEGNDPDFFWSRWGSTNDTGQYALVTSVSGNTITIEDPLVWDYTISPQLKYTSNYGMRKSGVEDLTIRVAPAYDGNMLKYWYAYASWIKNVETIGGDTNAHINLMFDLRNEVRDSYIHDSTSYSDGYGIETLADPANRGGTTGLLIENNIFSGLRKAVIMESETGSVYAYNYSRNIRFMGWPNYQESDLNSNHGPHGMMTLFEGNIAETGFTSDGYHGSVSHTTIFRNWFSGVHSNPAMTGNRKMIDLLRYSYYQNVMGNVLGDPSWNILEYEFTGQKPYTTTQAIYRIGYPNIGNNAYVPGNSPGNVDAPGLDPKVEETLVRWGNYDYFNHTTLWRDADIPTDVNVPLTNSLPASFYLSTRPSWFGSLQFPPIGPDVSGLRGDIPAKYCYDRGDMPNCLGSSLSPIVTLPPSPVTPPAPAGTTTSSTSGTASPTAAPGTDGRTTTPTPDDSTTRPTMDIPCVSAASTYIFSRDLSAGVSGPDVKALQQFLNGQGFTVALSGAGSRGAETSLYGPATTRAVKAFQTAKGISSTGYFGPLSRAAAGRVAPTGTCPTTTTATTSAPAIVSSAPLAFGDRNDRVKALQTALARFPGIYPEGLVTGYYGALTVQAVKRFQNFYGVASSTDPEYGTYGAKTRAKMRTVYPSAAI